MCFVRCSMSTESLAASTVPEAASVAVLIHRTQFPAAVADALRASLRAHAMNHKFHYDTTRQTLRWLRVHEAFSPARTDPDCGRIYDEAFASTATSLAGATEIEVVSLGCGGGQKDTRLLAELRRANPTARLRYVPTDVSVGLTLIAREAAVAAGVAPADCSPVVLDLALTADWAVALAAVLRPEAVRVVCFFGMLPNFAAGEVLPQLASLLRPADLLLVSANLAPGTDYAAGVAQVLPLYDNPLTRDWLWSVLQDLGAEPGDGVMRFRLAACPENTGLLRIEAVVTFLRDCRLCFEGENFDYPAGAEFRLFFSYRHTPARLLALGAPHGLSFTGHWQNQAGDEGVFLGGC